MHMSKASAAIQEFFEAIDLEAEDQQPLSCLELTGRSDFETPL